MADKIVSLEEAKSQKDKKLSDGGGDRNSGTTCPQCGALAIKPHTPFCSRRCAQLDLGKWLNEDYRVPADEVLDEGDVDALIAELEKDD